MTSPSAERPSGWELALLGLALLLFLLLAASIAVPAEEDAFIYYRYALHWAEGHGLVFNLGDPVEGFSSPLWMALLAALAGLGLDLPRAAPVLGLACGLATLAATHGLARAVGLSRLGRLAVVFALALSPLFVLWARSGLETPFYSLLLVLAARSYLAAPGSWRAGFAITPVALGRPEGILLLPIVAADRLAGRDLRGALRSVLPGAALYGAYVAWRFSTYHALQPNTSVKIYPLLVGRSTGQIAGYVLAVGVLPFVLPLLALPFRGEGSGFRPESRRPLAFLFSMVLVLSLFFNLAAGGDYRPGFRYMVPTLPHLLVAAWLAFEMLARGESKTARLLGSGPARALLCAALLAVPLAALVQSPPRPAAWRQAREIWLHPFADTSHWGVGIARWVDANVPPGSVVAFGQMGRVPYYVAARGHRIAFIDTLGLVDRQVAGIFRFDQKARDLARRMLAGESFGQALEGGRQRRAALLAENLLARRPDFILVEAYFMDLAPMRALTASPGFAAAYRRLGSLPATGAPYVWIYARRVRPAPRPVLSSLLWGGVRHGCRS
jgi:hypothetical protein